MTPNKLFSGKFLTFLAISLQLQVLSIQCASDPDATAADNSDLPTLYEYFMDTKNLTGLKAHSRKFWLNNKEIRIISGEIHYFRVHPALWHDRLQKLAAMGANTVSTYIAWNLHEPQKDVFDFGQLDYDLSPVANLRQFIELAQQEDLFVLIRPGPYICGELDYGGLPSWLQRDPNMQVRTNTAPFLERVRIYFDQLLPVLQPLQFTRGGPIIAVQIENEYGYQQNKSIEYLGFIKKMLDQYELSDSLYLTGDNEHILSLEDGYVGSMHGMFLGGNFAFPDKGFKSLSEIQPDMPLFVLEFWTGWYFQWGSKVYDKINTENFTLALEDVLFKWNASLNFYMFHGGTTFGLYAGGYNMAYEPYIAGDITSYDFTAPLTESGDYTEKYHIAREYVQKAMFPRVRRPPLLPAYPTVKFDSIKPEKYLSYEELIEQIPNSAKFTMERATSMENLPMNGDSGQSFGYIIYRKILQLSPDKQTIYKGLYPRDLAFLLVNGKLVKQTSYWINSPREIPLKVDKAGEYTIDLLVETLGRESIPIAYLMGKLYLFGTRDEKGISPAHNGSIWVDGEELKDIEIIAMEFSCRWVKKLRRLRRVEKVTEKMAGPVLLEFTLNIDKPGDTWLDMQEWTKGIVFVNGFNIGKYWRVGPQQTLYVPGPLLHRGANKIRIFEQIMASTELVFRLEPILWDNKELVYNEPENIPTTLVFK